MVAELIYCLAAVCTWIGIAVWYAKKSRDQLSRILDEWMESDSDHDTQTIYPNVKERTTILAT